MKLTRIKAKGQKTHSREVLYEGHQPIHKNFRSLRNTLTQNTLGMVHSRLHSFFREVIEDREDTLILPSRNSSSGLACFRNLLYSSV